MLLAGPHNQVSREQTNEMSSRSAEEGNNGKRPRPDPLQIRPVAKSSNTLVNSNNNIGHDDEADEDEGESRTKGGHWGPVLGTMRKVDKKTLESMKDDIGNLLIFTGLFSAVVTAFVVFSLMMLQPDTSDATVQLLSQLVNQTAAYSVSPRLINSTQPSIPATPSGPPDYLVSVNKVWFTSLTLSLIVAFFSLTMQQWLRYMPVSLDTPVREAIRLRQYRRKGWTRWYADNVISLLSLSLQAAVALFVVGLIILLRNTNKSISAPVEGLSIAWLAIFMFASLAPLLDPSSPCKSALSSLEPVWNIALSIGASLLFMMLFTVNIAMDFLPQRRFIALTTKRVARLTKRIEDTMSLPKPTGNSVWVRRELKEISDPGRISSLDVKALVWASAAEAAADELDIARCFEDLSKDLQPRFILEQIALKINKRPGRRHLLVDETLSANAAQGITSDFVDEHSALLARAVSLLEPEEWYTSKRYHPARKDAPHLLILAWKFLQSRDKERIQELPSETLLEAERTPRRSSAAIDSDPCTPGVEDLQRIFLSQLIAVCLAQQFKKNDLENWEGWGTHVCVPAVLLFDVLIPSSSTPVRPPEGDPWCFVEWANNAAQLVNSPDWGQYARKFTITPQELLLSSSAVALHALAASSNATLHLLVQDPPTRHTNPQVLEPATEPAHDATTAAHNHTDEQAPAENQVHDADVKKRRLVSLLGHVCDFLKAEPYTASLIELPRFLRDSETLPFITRRALCSIYRSLQSLEAALHLTETQVDNGTDDGLVRSLHALQSEVLKCISEENHAHVADSQHADREADCAEHANTAAISDSRRNRGTGLVESPREFEPGAKVVLKFDS